MRKRTLTAVVIVIVSLSSLIALGARARKTSPQVSAQQQQQQNGWRKSTLTALTLVSAEPRPDNPRTVVYRLRNDSGRGIAGFILSHDESEHTPGSHHALAKMYVTQLDPEFLPPGSEQELAQDASTVERLSAVMYEDGSVEGEAESIDFLISEVRQFEEGLAQERFELQKACGAKGVAKGTAEIVARIDEGMPLRNTGGQQRVVIGQHKSTGAIAFEGELRELLSRNSPAEAKAELERHVRTRLSKSWVKGGAQ